MGMPLGARLAELPFFSQFIGWLFRHSWTKKKIQPFIDRFGIDTKEFERSVESYPSFNAFFIRTLKKESRPLAQGPIIPADGRYLMYQDITSSESFVVK